VLERSVLDLIPAGRAVSIERDVFPRLAGAGLHALNLEGYWMDIGTPERYLQASWDILEGRVETRVEPTAPGVLVSPSAEVAPDATVGPRAVVGPGCQVGAGARIAESVLLERSVVGEGTRLERTILAPGAIVAPDAALTDAVAGADERLPA
jgi:mannose-1-phosphate guanylyltransferase